MSFKIRTRAASQKVTWFLGTRMPKTFQFVFVVGYPRSGTTWACQLIAECLELPFPRYSLLPIGFPAVLHGHALMKKSYSRAVYVVRDGRDVMISDYFQLSRPIAEGDHPRLNSRLRKMFPGLINKADVKRNLPSFMEQQFKHPASCRYNWPEHVQSFFDMPNNEGVLLRYEDLLQDGNTALAKVIGHLTGDEPDPRTMARALDKFSFTRQSGRPPGQEDRSTFLRKGQVGDWKKHFTRESAEAFDHYGGEMLIHSEYEHDRDWFTTVANLEDSEFSTPNNPIV